MALFKTVPAPRPGERRAKRQTNKKEKPAKRFFCFFCFFFHIRGKKNKGKGGKGGKKKGGGHGNNNIWVKWMNQTKILFPVSGANRKKRRKKVEEKIQRETKGEGSETTGFFSGVHRPWKKTNLLPTKLAPKRGGQKGEQKKKRSDDTSMEVYLPGKNGKNLLGPDPGKKDFQEKKGGGFLVKESKPKSGFGDEAPKIWGGQTKNNRVKKKACQ